MIVHNVHDVSKNDRIFLKLMYINYWTLLMNKSERAKITHSSINTKSGIIFGVKQIKRTNRAFETLPSTNLTKRMKILLQNSTSLTAPITLLQTSVEFDHD